MVIHFARQGVMLGQYPEDGVAHLVKAHAIRPSDYYWHDGMSEWTPVAASRWMPAEPAMMPAEPVALTKTTPGFSPATAA